MNEEKKIAQAILDAQEMREKSYDEESGQYAREIEECIIAACKCRGLSPNLWCLLSLAMHWFNDVQLWAEDVLANRIISKKADQSGVDDDSIEDVDEKISPESNILDHFEWESGSECWPSDDPSDSPSDAFMCKHCGAILSLQMYGELPIGASSFMDYARQELSRHLAVCNKYKQRNIEG